MLVAAGLLAATVLHPLPYPSPDGLAFLTGSSTRGERRAISGEFLYFARHEARSYDAIEFFLEPETVPSRGDAEDPITLCRVSAGLLHELGPSLLAGRLPVSGHEVVLTEGLQKMLFPAGAAEAIGKSVLVGHARYEVAGVLPRRFFFPDRQTQMYALFDEADPVLFRTTFVHGVLRLKAGTTAGAAREELRLISARFADQYRVPITTGLHPLPEVMLGSQPTALWFLLGTCAVLVVLASANVAQLQVSEFVRRLPELSVRIALGSTVRRETNRILVHRTLLIGVGTGAGALLASVAIGALKTARLHSIVGLDAARVGVVAPLIVFVSSWTVLAATTLISLRRLRASELPRFLHAGGFSLGSSTLALTVPRRLGILTIQIALALALVGLAGSLVGTFRRLTNADWGFSAPGVAILDYRLPTPYSGRPNEQTELVETLLRRVRTLPGVTAASVGYTAPFRAGSWKTVLLAVNGEYRAEGALYKVSPEYFRTLGTKVLQGHDFPSRLDPATEPALVLSRRVATRLFPGRDAVGRRIRIMNVATDQTGRVPLSWVVARAHAGDESVFAEPGALQPAEDVERVVIGVVEDVRMGGLDLVPRWGVYMDYRQQYKDDWYGELDHRLLIRSGGGATEPVRTIRQVIAQMIPGAAVGRATTLEEHVRLSIGAAGAGELARLSLSAMSLAALALTAVGVFGMTRAIMTARQYRHAVQIALGATSGVIRRQVASILLWRFATGVLIAACGIFTGGRVMRALLPLGMNAVWYEVTTAVIVTLLALMLPLVMALRRLALLQPADLLRR